MAGHQRFRDHAEEIEHHAKLARAFEAGRKSGETDQDTIACPYTPNSEAGKEWFLGFKKGRELTCR